jgi:hypothetical protein
MVRSLHVRDRSEDAACDNATLDFGEPDLDLIEPRRVSRREVESNARVAIHEPGPRWRVVGGDEERSFAIRP